MEPTTDFSVVSSIQLFPAIIYAVGTLFCFQAFSVYGLNDDVSAFIQ